MTIDFFKFEGSGNDFIIIDNRNLQYKLSNANIKRLCDRKFGVGADGLMLYNSSDEFEFNMSYFNADGNEGSMCGNGGRCMLAFSHLLGNSNKKISFNAIDGYHEGHILESKEQNNWLVQLKMSDVSIYHEENDFFEINTGSPHYITFVENVNQMDVYAKGKEIRYNNRYSDNGINVNFAEEKDKSLFVRTYERGVENETLSCGTGVTASALAYAIKNNIEQNFVKIQTLGGVLEVSFSKENNSFKNIWLKGPATLVFKGKIEI